jgi:DNA (cytosine-5)-methyltransferase 1
LIAVDHDERAAGTFHANHHPERLVVAPIEDWRQEIPEVDVVLGGPPCQGFSQLGLNDPDDPRNVLWREYFRVVRQARPLVFVLENVAAFQRSPEFKAFLEQCSVAGYPDPWVATLNAHDYGTPQKRRRTIVVGLRRDLHDSLRTPRAIGESIRSIAGGVIQDAIRMLESEPLMETLPQETYTFRDWRGVEHSVPGTFLSSDLHLARRPTQASIERYRHIGPGQNRHALPSELQTPGWRKHKTGSGDVMGRLVWDEPSVTIRTEFFKPEKGRYLHPSLDRPITHREAAALQGFPADYQWCGSKIDIARQIGNAVPPSLAHAIGTAVQEWIAAPDERRAHQGGPRQGELLLRTDTLSA